MAIKGLETVLVRQDDVETFGYTSLLEAKAAERAHLSSAPFVAQQALNRKAGSASNRSGRKGILQFSEEPGTTD